MRKLEIDRATWLRGEGNAASRLIRERDGKKCCIGFYLEACGMAKEFLLNRGEPAYLRLPDEAKWLDDRYKYACPLYSANDAEDYGGEEQREAEIATLFRLHDVEVTFTN